MIYLSFPFLSVGLCIVLLGALVLPLLTKPGAVRWVSFLAALACEVCFLFSAREALGMQNGDCYDSWWVWLRADALGAVGMSFYGALACAGIAMAPRRDATAAHLSGILLITFATELTYCAANLVMLTAGWWLTSVPFLIGCFGRNRRLGVAEIFLLMSCGCLSAAVGILHVHGTDHLSDAGRLALALLIAAVVLRKGLFPFHAWVIAEFEHGALMPTALIFNGHLGALLICRISTSELPHYATRALTLLGDVGLITALIASIRCFAERKPRRILALICVSQAAFILGGLATSNIEGITGALLHWLVVSAASTGLIAIVRCLEVRVLDARDPKESLGLAVKAPRMAAFFLICGLALIGLPGTLAYCAEDLLFQGALQSHPFLGLALPVATAFNGINLVRLFGILFLGVLPKDVADVPDALPRERWPLAACVVFLIFGGLCPSKILPWRSDAAAAIEHAFNGKKSHH